MNGFAAFFILILFVIIAIAGGWIIYTHVRARRLGLPPPTFSSYNPFKSSSSSFGAPGPARGGVIGWVQTKIRAFKNRNNRSAGGAYEEPLSSNVRGANRGFGPLDPDEAWDARVGHGADSYGLGGHYEEQELGRHGESTRGLGLTPGATSERGRSTTRDMPEPEPYIGGSHAGLDRRYEEEIGRKPATNPFDDEHAEASLRGVSPRPMEGKDGDGHSPDSPTERRSMFTENV